MEIPSSFSAVTSLIILFLFLFKLINNSKSSKLPPGPWKLPILGNLLQVAGSIPHRGLRELAKKHGPIMHIQLGEISAIVISNPRVAKEVLKTHDLKFADRPELLLGTVILENCRDIVLARYSEFWRQMRKVCTLELLSANKVRSFRYIREDEVKQLIESIKSSLSSPINISEKVSSLANNITCRATIGERCKYQHELIEQTEAISYWGSGFFMADLFPTLKFLPNLTGMKPALMKLRGELDRIFEHIIKDHKEKLASRKEGDEIKAEDQDLVDVLLRINERLEFPISDKDIQAIIVNMFTAGTDTSSAILDWAMSELMRNPQVMEKAQAEVRQALKGKTLIQEADVQELSYLKLVIKETLRLHAPVPLLLPRECREQCEIDGYTIPVKTKVMVNAWAIGRDPETWDNAESFIPERFENNPIDYMGANYEYIPFGAGRRMCAGISFGMASLQLPLAQLLYQFNWKLPNNMKPEDVDMSEIFAATNKRKNNLFLIASPYVPTQDSS